MRRKYPKLDKMIVLLCIMAMVFTSGFVSAFADGEAAHIHGEQCFCKGGELLCGLEESDVHSHSDDCYCKGGEILCGFEEGESEGNGSQNEAGPETPQNQNPGASDDGASGGSVPNSENSGEGKIIEDVKIEESGITYTLDLDTAEKAACLTDISEPQMEQAVTVPEKITHENVEYTVTKLQWGFFSSERENVTELKLPDTLIEASVSFGKFPSLKELVIPGSIRNFDGDFQYMKKLQTLTFGEGVEEISGNSMVSYCDSLTEVNLPSTLKSITAPAVFSKATALKSISLPEGLVVTEGSLFAGCTALTGVELPASMKEIPSSTFSGCTGLESVTAKGTITSVGSSAFNECENLTTIPDLSQVTKVEESAFNGCAILTGPVDLGNVTEMGSKAFYNCQKLTGALDLSNLDVIPNKAFSYTSIDSVTLSDSLTSIGIWAFLYTDIPTIEFPDTLTSIGTYAFWNAKKLGGTVTIPDSVTTIGNYAFKNTVVEKFEIGSGIESINANVFEANAALKEIVFDNSQDDVAITGTIPANVTVTYTQPSIPDDMGDKISDDVNALTLQEAVNAAAAEEKGGTVTLEKHIKLDNAVTVPAGQTVTITAEEPYQIAGTKTATDLKNLFVVEEGGSLVISGQVILFGRYNTGSIVLNYGALELTGDAVVTGSKITSDSANGTGSAGLGVIDSRGEGAVFTLSGGKVTDNALNSTVSYSGIVRASDGARVEITGGEISENSASAAAALNCSSGVLLYGNAAGAMSGGTISENTGHRGSAVMLWGGDADHRTTFELSGSGAITGNACTSAGKVTGSGAVHVESNASFTMTGGRISDNKGVQGAGVCVVDGNLQTAQPEYKTAFIMDGGIISENRGSTGGGIYSYSNGVDLKSGEIINNTAANMGGGIYSEGNYDYYSTLHLKNALISGNAARQGGGMWFCATGKASVHVTEGAAIFDNTARDADSQKGAGDDFVFSARPADDYSATLANRMLGGGAVRWYKDGAVYLPSAGVYPTTSDTTPRYGAEGADSNPVTVTGYRDCLALKAVPLSEDVKTVAAKEAALFITGNTADKGGGIGANGGIVIGDEDTTSVSVEKKWSGGAISDRKPVTVELLNGETVIDTAELNAGNDWKHTFEGLPPGYVYSVREKTQVPGFSTSVSGNMNDGFVITNTYTGEELPPVVPEYTSVRVDKVWKLDDGGVAADSVTVQLLRNGEVYDTAVLSEANGWTKTWDRLSGIYSWTVQEIDVPEGFKAEITHTGNHWVITNDDTGEKPPVDPDNPDNPDKPGKPENPGKPHDLGQNHENPNVQDGNENPKTGDSASLSVYFFLLTGSLAAASVMTVYRRKEKSEQKESK